MPTTEKIAFRLSTPYGNHYHVTTSGNIIRLDQPDFVPSGQWSFLGLQHVKRSEFIPFADVVRMVANGTLPALSYKNGNPQFTVRDFDHGSVRVWGNTKYHGVRSLSKA
jgi:hypothetical protein